MLYTEKEKHEIERVKEVFAEHLRQSPDFELLWSDKVGYVWLTIGVNPVYVDTGIRIESAADLCGKCLDDVATDVLYMTGNDHALEAAEIRPQQKYPCHRRFRLRQDALFCKTKSDADAQFIRCHRPEGYGAGRVRQDARKGRLCHQVAEHHQFPEIHALQPVQLHPQREGHPQAGQYDHRQHEGRWR